MPHSPPNAVVWCDGAFRTPVGRPTRSLVRRSRRYTIHGVVDASCGGADAGVMLDGQHRGIPVAFDLDDALDHADDAGVRIEALVIGVEGRLTDAARRAARSAVAMGLDVVSGATERLADNADLRALAVTTGARIVDLLVAPGIVPIAVPHDPRAVRIAVLGTDRAVGKRTTAWMLVDALAQQGHASELIGTNATSWLQGADFSVVLGGMPTDLVATAVADAANRACEAGADHLVVHGVGSLLHPLRPAGLEILAGFRPDAIVLQHAPAHTTWADAPDVPHRGVTEHLRALSALTDVPVVAITLHADGATDDVRRALAEETGRVVAAPLVDGVDRVLAAVRQALTDRVSQAAPRPDRLGA